MPAQAFKLFYKGSKLHALLTSSTQHRIVSANDLNLGETDQPAAQARLLATDGQNSTISVGSNEQALIAYSPFGMDNCPPASPVLCRYTGQRRSAATIGYMLGNGHRLFSPETMRFNSPDNLSPFASGGLNAYAYCGNDPINRTDPSGKSFRSIFKWRAGGYTYKKLAPRLDKRNPALSRNEFKALEKSLEKRQDRLASKLSLAIERGLQYTSNNLVTEGEMLQRQRSTLKGLALDESNRYNPDITRELFGEIPFRDGSDSQLARELLATPRHSVDAAILEEFPLEDMQARLNALRSG